MSVRSFRALRLLLAALSVLAVTSVSHAALTLSADDVTVTPGDTSVKMIIKVTNTLSTAQMVSSFNPAVALSTLSGTGTATFAGPNTGAEVNQASSNVASGLTMSVFGNAGADPSATINPNDPDKRKYALNPLPSGSTVTLAGNGMGELIELTIGLAGHSLGDMYQLDLVADLNNDGFIDSRWADGASSTFAFQGGTAKISVVPEPSAFLLVGLIGCVGLVGKRFRDRRRASATTAA